MPKLNFDLLNQMVKNQEISGKIEKKYIDSDLLKGLNLAPNEFKKFGSIIKRMVDDEELCNNSKTCPFESRTHIRLLRDGKGKIVSTTVQCEKFLKEKKSQGYIKNYLIRNFPDDNLEIRLSKKFFSSEMDESATKIIANYVSMAKTKENIPHGSYIYGDYGIGKTYSAIAFANELTRKNVKVSFVFVPDIVYRLKQGFNSNTGIENEKIVEAMKNADVLFLDDIGSEEASLWFYNEYLLVVLNHRMQRRKTTFFISNLSLNDLQRKMIQKKNDPTNVARLIERIKALTKNTELKMLGKNLRY